MLTVNRLGLPTQLRRSLACTNSIENMMGTVRRVCRNVKRWRNADMALRWTTAGMMEATKGFRRLKAHKQLPILKAALAAHQAKHTTKQKLEQDMKAAKHHQPATLVPPSSTISGTSPTRMRLALMVLRETGYARIDAATPPRPIIIPSTKLLKLLASDHLTTDVEPLVLTSLRRLISPDEAMHHVQYLEAFTAALQNGIGVYVDVHTTILNMWGIGLLRQRRGPSGKLEWSLSKEARQAGSFEKALKICLTIHRSHCC